MILAFVSSRACIFHYGYCFLFFICTHTANCCHICASNEACKCGDVPRSKEIAQEESCSLECSIQLNQTLRFNFAKLASSKDAANCVLLAQSGHFCCAIENVSSAAASKSRASGERFASSKTDSHWRRKCRSQGETEADRETHECTANIILLMLFHLDGSILERAIGESLSLHKLSLFPFSPYN